MKTKLEIFSKIHHESSITVNKNAIQDHSN